MDYKEIIENVQRSGDLSEFAEIFESFLTDLENGTIRAAWQTATGWKTCTWVKKGILIGFKLGTIIEYKVSANKSYLDKSTFPERNFTTADQIRIVPGGTSIRRGAHLGKSIIIMPPSYINVGAYVDDGSLIDSHALVGTCAQIGKNVHLSAAAQIGGVIEPVGANPVIIEDNVFIGGNCGIYEGVIVKKNAIIAAGVILTAGTPVYDAVNDKFLPKITGKAVIIPENAVIVSGSRLLKSNNNFSIYCPIIIKYRDEKSDTSVELESIIR
ncbi:MAG: 2,3,4,5-tetrahydropyridine-2,6-dicarboxylate N-succinyltransferase [Candidatus Cloacimonetes bacterium]|nr:2,3,4,5-tetrahydropyridine-2,6-dicarboxylate N-succinyltransferase [Candidatus Cloacimonadota bacterium]